MPIPTPPTRLDQALYIAPLLNLAVTASGFLATVYGIRRLRHTARRDIVSALFTQNAQARSMIAARPHIRKYFFGGATLVKRGNDDYEYIITVAEIYLNYLEHLMVEQATLKIGLEAVTWTNTVIDSLIKSQIMTDIATEQQQWYAPELVYIAIQVKRGIIEPSKIELLPYPTIKQKIYIIRHFSKAKRASLMKDFTEEAITEIKNRPLKKSKPNKIT